MKLVEFASAEEQLALWKLVSDNVWAAISQQAKAEAEQKAQQRAQAKKLHKAKHRAMPPPPSVPPPPKPFVQNPNIKPYVGKAVSKPATQLPAQPQQATGVSKSIRPKQSDNALLPQGLQQGIGSQKNAVAGR